MQNVNRNEQPEKENRTPLREPSEDIQAGASNTDQLDRLKENAHKDPVKPEDQIGASPGEDGDQ